MKEKTKRQLLTLLTGILALGILLYLLPLARQMAPLPQKGDAGEYSHAPAKEHVEEINEGKRGPLTGELARPERQKELKEQSHQPLDLQ